MSYGLYVDDADRVVRRVNLDRVDPSTPPDVTADTLPDEPVVGRGERAVLYVVAGEPVWQVESRPLNDDERLEDVEVKVGNVPAWEPAQTVTVGDKRTYDRVIYACQQAHTTQGDWTPDVTPALWGEVGPAPPSPQDWITQLRGVRSDVESASNLNQLRAAVLSAVDVLTGDT